MQSDPELETATLDTKAIEEIVRDALREIYDPEIPNVNIVDLGLIYEIKIDEQRVAHITMTLTNPNCPVAETFPQMVQNKAMEVSEISGVTLQLVWEPPWDKEKMSEAALLTLGLL